MIRLFKNPFNVLLCCVLFSLVGCAPLTPKAPATPAIYDELGAVETFYGTEARSRVQAWRQLIQRYQQQPVSQQLTVTNDFFNQLVFEEDSKHWQAEDYWATPIETIATFGGDCEDFATGKYFTLIAMGIPDHCLKMTYVKALTLNQAHMVLSYQCSQTDSRLILDNLIQRILPAEQRSDLAPVYSFNAHNYWLTKSNHHDQRLGGPNHLSRWQSLLLRVQQPLKP